MDSFNQLLNKEDSNLDTSLIMYAEQLARKDVEINSLRSKRKELEGRVRQGRGSLLQNSYLELSTLVRTGSRF